MNLASFSPASVGSTKRLGSRRSGRGFSPGVPLRSSLTFLWDNYTLVYRAIWRLNADQSAEAI